jgi:hypothetical protein
MDQSEEDPRELHRQIELATRIASSVTDQTTGGAAEGLDRGFEAEAAATVGGETH